MKVFASLLLVVLVAFAAVQASVQPTPAPHVEKRQSFNPYDISQYTNPAAISSLSAFITSQFGSLSGVSLPPEQSSALASQESMAYSYLSLASSIVFNGGASNSAFSSVASSLTNTASISSAASSFSSSLSSAASSAASSRTSSGASNAALGGSVQIPGFAVGMAACTFVAAFAGAFML
ncbi:hypothetical protein PSEUBRA_002781 [Kalmanozyma brasiliensis GHG001]|uniref:Uncharacterized protein n=1 Tax=Kalmanozyma brasiliensis (strain GHG001) TaxID=1365824 RepID=V5EBB5_KALBG|nr:uncharacterized protein PSEUBRA_002781 [Kalmanozyma brasiliensis GHG001]EST07686.1 hypothetical protein PSEUBRA_002781 [Kalmanozyma brasiliensis GHG001]